MNSTNPAYSLTKFRRKPSTSVISSAKCIILEVMESQKFIWQQLNFATFKLQLNRLYRGYRNCNAF